jgi:bifunctional DNase/RNase
MSQQSWCIETTGDYANWPEFGKNYAPPSNRRLCWRYGLGDIISPDVGIESSSGTTIREQVMIKVFIDSIRVSLMSQLRVVILKDPVSGKYLPIFIGPCEAEAIAVKLQNVSVERPLTHDLLKSVIAELGGRVQHIVVNDLRQDTFYAQIVVDQNGQNRIIDSRPSDAIALSVRLDVPIYVAESVMDRAGIMPDEEVESEIAPTAPGGEGESGERLSLFEDFVESLDLDDLENSDDDEDDND